MIGGEFENDELEENLYWQMLGYILILLTNVLLLNLIVAIMGDTYAEVMNSVDEKNLKQQNLMIIRCEGLMLGKQEEISGNLVFL